MDCQFRPGQPIQFEETISAPPPSVTGSLTQKGYGHIYDSGETSNLSMSYANVDGGIGPAAGDLVVWFFFAGDTAASPILDLTGSGWAQGSNYVSTLLAATILAKVTVSGDISSPPQVVSSPDRGSIGFWVAYTVTGTVASVAVSSVSLQYPNASAPSNQTADSSALNSPDVGIAVAAGGGDDGSPSMSISGGAADVNFTSSANQWLFSLGESQFLANATVGGASITFSKGDDGALNHMGSGYVTVSF